MRVFVGSEALAAGTVTRYDLRAGYRRVLPDVYVVKSVSLTLTDRTTAAWLWSQRRAVISGRAASALHGARWVADDATIELIHANNKAPAGLVARRETVHEAEVIRLNGIPVTTVERTAFDLARHSSVRQAVAGLDALARATHFTAADVLTLADRHPHVRGLRRLPTVLGLVDGGAQSPKETWLRLVLIEAGFPRPETQIPVLAPDGYPRYFLDLGWRDVMVAVEYDGEQHRTDSAQFRGDVQRAEYIESLGWRRIRVLAGDRAADIVRRVERAGMR